MSERIRKRRYARRNNYCHAIRAKIGTHALQVIYVDLNTMRLELGTRLKPGDRLRYREQDSIYSPLMLGVVADETTQEGPLFITLLESK